MSRVVRVGLRVLRAPVADGIAMSFSPLRHRSAVLVQVRTEDGRIGQGESWTNDPPWAVEERVVTLSQGVLPLLLGQDASRIAAVHRRLCAKLDPLGRQWGAPGPIRQAISAVDVALWDLAGQRAGAAASGLAASGLAAGRVRDEIPVYASSLGPDNVSDTARRCTLDGHRAVKLELGFGAAMAPVVEGVEYDIRDNPLRDPLLLEPPVPDNGTVRIPELPGLGVRFDEAAIAEVTDDELDLELSL